MRKFYGCFGFALVTLFSSLWFSLFSPAIPTVQAAQCKDEPTFLTIKPWYHNLCKAGTNTVEVPGDPVNGFVVPLILNLLSIALQLAGYVAVGFVIWGGIKYMTSVGEPGKIASGKSIVTNALIGLLIVLAAVAIIDFVTAQYA